MMTKLDKTELLKKYSQKEDRFFVSSIIDKIEKSKYQEVSTNFLDSKYLQIGIAILNKYNVEYKVIAPNENCEKQVIVLNSLNFDINEYVTCIKIIPNVATTLVHKDYMGAIYSLGLKREMIGDIFAFDTCAYVFVIDKNEQYILNNLLTVSKYKVETQSISLELDEVKNLSNSFVEKRITIPSLRVDVVLSTVYNLSRSIVKEKINSGELFVNTIQISHCDYTLSVGDIVSLKRCGKIKIGEVVNKTKNQNLVLEIYKYS